MNSLLRSLLRLLGLILVLASLAFLAASWVLRGSLPRLDGGLALKGLEGPVVVERDAAGVPTLDATHRLDALRALGFVHAQERFFQMDLLRRAGAGELAALLGPSMVETDHALRLHRLRAAARTTVEQLDAPHRAQLDAYVAGVNAGLDSLRVRPPEYLVLRATPEPWRAEDSLLVGGAMFFSLQEALGRDDVRRADLRRDLPPAALAFFYPEGSPWDAALDRTELALPPPPPPEVLDFRSIPSPGASLPAPGAGGPETASSSRTTGFFRFYGDDPPPGSSEGATWNDLVPGSNSWGVQGSATTNGAAIVSNDMHLDHGVPNIWFRARLRWTDTDGQRRMVVGVSLPGIPAMIVGSNGDIAWGFTNATLDTSDLLDLEFDPENPRRYRTPEGWRDLETVAETIAVRGAPSQTFAIDTTVWGPVVGGTGKAPRRALLWIAHRPGAMDLGLSDLNVARSTEEALKIAATSGIPVQNLLVGDRQGNLAWTLIGRLPKRVGTDGSVPIDARNVPRPWDGWLEPAAYPRIEASPGGRLWTANNRIAGSPEYLALGAADTDLGARARQIRDALTALPAPVSEAEVFSLHRDDRALFLARWQELMARVLEKSAPTNDAARWNELAQRVRDWGGRAAVESAGYRLVRAFRVLVSVRIMEPVFARIRARAENPARIALDDRHEHPVWTLLEARPAHLLNPRYPSYDALLADAVRALLQDLDRQNLTPATATWGARNVVRVQHPLSKAVPRLSPLLDQPPVALPGDSHMTRVQGADFGASERLVVSPGSEERGFFHMPGGQSGHFLSPYFRSGFEAWCRVEPTPLLPGPTAHRLVLGPGK